MPSASSLRARIADLFRCANLAPAVLIIAGISFLAHVLVGTNYRYFRDELYVLAMSHHSAFGYVDVPPLVPWITLIPRFLTGNALWAIHVMSALVCAGTSCGACVDFENHAPILILRQPKMPFNWAQVKDYH